MWYECENGGLERPEEVDTESSKVYVYVRRDITLVEAQPEEEDGEEAASVHYRWMEAKIPKNAWPILEKAIGHDAALDDVYAALTELAEIVVGG